MSVSQCQCHRLSINNNNNSSNNSSNNISECSSVIEDILQPIKLFSSDINSDDENELIIADRVKLHKLTQTQTSTSSVPEPPEEWLAMQGDHDSFILKMSSFINMISPRGIFNVKKSIRRRRKKTTKLVHPELVPFLEQCR